MRYIVQAVNGVGLVTLVTNFGDYFIPGIDPGQTASAAQPTSLTLISPPASGPYGTPATFSAQLEQHTANHAVGIPGQIVEFSYGSQRRQVVTNAAGLATVSLPLIGLVGPDQLQVTFAGNATYKGSSASSVLTINKQSTSLTLDATACSGQYSDDTNLQATLIAGTDWRLSNRTVFFVAGTPAETLSATSTNITDYAGRVPAGPVNLPAGIYPVTAYFLGVIPIGGGQTVTLSDSRYVASTGAGTLVQTAEDATVTYTGQTSIASGTATGRLRSGRASRRRFTWRPDPGLGGVRRAQWPQSGRGNSHGVRDCGRRLASVYPWFTGRQIHFDRAGGRRLLRLAHQRADPDHRRRAYGGDAEQLQRRRSR